VDPLPKAPSARSERSRDLFRRLRPDARILLVRLRSMGDCLLLTSAIRAIKAEFPSFRLSVLVEDRFADVYDANPDIAEIIRVRGKAGTIARLLPRRFDAIVNLHGGPTSLVYAMSARATRIGSEHHQHAGLYSATYPRPDGDVHTVESTLQVFRWLGVRTSVAPALRYESHREAAARIASRLSGADLLANAPYVVVHPAAVMDTKRWPADRFAALIAWLRAAGFAVVMTCGPGEDALVASIQQMTDQAMALPGLSIPELAELIRGARCYIGNDSGPMHLATALGTPTVAIWGSSSSVRWHPWGVEHRVVQNPFSCNPCPGYRCLVASSPLCIESVTVAQVQAAVHELLAGGQTVTAPQSDRSRIR
jgi:predicted lipopolysaccharide heptosyltransferase III